MEDSFTTIKMRGTPVKTHTVRNSEIEQGERNEIVVIRPHVNTTGSIQTLGKIIETKL